MAEPIREEILQVCLDIVNASDVEDEERVKASFASLKKLCEASEATEDDHPLQWEALGDFSETYEDAVLAYEKGLKSAENLKFG